MVFESRIDRIVRKPVDCVELVRRKSWLVSEVAQATHHTLRHTYRSWLDAVGTTIAVQQKLMRHANIRTTMNVYGTVVTEEMSTASGKVARLVVNGTGDGTEPSSSH
jgi:integrase